MVDWSVVGGQQFQPWREFVRGEPHLPRRPERPRPRFGDPWWARHPTRGDDGRIYYPTRDLAAALGLTPSRLRRWICSHWIPDTPFRRLGVTREGNRRLYSRAMIEAAIRIATEEGVIERKRCNGLGESPFGIRVAQTWARLNEQGRALVSAPPKRIPRLPPVNHRP